MTSQPSFNKPTTPDWQHGPELPSQPSAVSSYQIEKSGTETFDETIAMEDEGDYKIQIHVFLLWEFKPMMVVLASINVNWFCIAISSAVEVKSVYVRNVPTTMSASEIGEEFKKFGKLRPDGVAIRTRKVYFEALPFPLSTFVSRYLNSIAFLQDIDVCYAFVEFEDISGVQNAIKV